MRDSGSVYGPEVSYTNTDSLPSTPCVERVSASEISLNGTFTPERLPLRYTFLDLGNGCTDSGSTLAVLLRNSSGAALMAGTSLGAAETRPRPATGNATDR